MAGTHTFVSTLPACDFAGSDCADGGARFDFRVKTGVWAAGCIVHWSRYAANGLGTGSGQLLCLPGETPGAVAVALARAVTRPGWAREMLYEKFRDVLFIRTIREIEAKG